MINGSFYVVGGQDSLSRSVSVLDRYDPATDTWQTLGPLPVAGTARGAVLEGKFFVVVTTSTFVRRAYAYDPATNQWTPKAAPHWDHPEIVRIIWGVKPYLLAVGGIHFNPGVQPNPTEVCAP